MEHPRDHAQAGLVAHVAQELVELDAEIVSRLVKISGIVAIGVKSVAALLQPFLRRFVGFLFHVLKL
ncbi:hypothetical protein [Mesorhizobium sp.]|uniref:hypothetical protein n=1 Tax=Mesorhizobium sp. TaxID=1871066 RepID=UPI00257CFB6D|nr:hypothetical protein [Mesorhizobium sp.]